MEQKIKYVAPRVVECEIDEDINVMMLSSSDTHPGGGIFEDWSWGGNKSTSAAEDIYSNSFDDDKMK
ncbi:MAG: hypothetical protein MJZ01_01920 [Bacteroidales bacterium]|nr:hypothetical protein [Bacteroidales bacterium]